MGFSDNNNKKISAVCEVFSQQSPSNPKSHLLHGIFKERELLGEKKLTDSLHLQRVHSTYWAFHYNNNKVYYYLWKCMQKPNKRSYPYALNAHASFERQPRRNGSPLSILSFTSQVTQLSSSSRLHAPKRNSSYLLVIKQD